MIVIYTLLGESTCFILFFFSSRRRHTRLSGDWSSDVCSSDLFELWCWRRLLRVPWSARRSNQSILKDISLGCSLEGMMLKLKLQYFGHHMQRGEKTLMLGGIGGRRRGSRDCRSPRAGSGSASRRRRAPRA